eukprot:1146884-Pelagomonas_calceolata.AAC.2
MASYACLKLMNAVCNLLDWPGSNVRAACCKCCKICRAPFSNKRTYHICIYAVPLTVQGLPGVWPTARDSV